MLKSIFKRFVFSCFSVSPVFAVLSASLLAGLLTGSPAVAQTSVYCVNCATEITASSILQAVNNAKSAIVQAISGATTTQGSATLESAKIIADANTRTATELEKTNVKLKAEPIDPCGVTAAARGGSSVSIYRSGGGGAGGGGSARSPTAGASPEMVKAIKIANGAAPAPAPEVTAALAVKGACGTFAKDGLRALACKAAGFSANASSGFPDADIQAETIFDGPQNAADKAGGLHRKLTIASGDVPERTAVEAFIRNLEMPLDLKTLDAKENNTEPGRNYMALRDSYNAVMSLATKPVRDQQSLITANKLTLPIIKQLMKSEDGPYVLSRLSSSFPAWKTEGISFAELMQLEADRRYLNASWYARMAAANEKQLLAEQVQMQAFAGWLNVSMLERLQQQSVIQGTTAGAALRTEKLPQLIAAHRAAQR